LKFQTAWICLNIEVRVVQKLVFTVKSHFSIQSEVHIRLSGHL